MAGVRATNGPGLNDVALFELGQAYRGDKPDDQYLSAAGVRAGSATLTGSGRHWSGKAEDAGVFDAKADVFAALAALGFDAGKAQITRDCPAWYHPGRSGTLRLGPKVVLAHFGDLHPATLKAMDAEGPVAAFEIFLDALPPEKKKSRTKPPLAAADLLPVSRDFAFIVAKDVAAADVIKAAAGVDRALVQSVEVFDIFEGGALASEGKKSIAIEVTLQPTEATLTDRDIETISARIIDGVKKATGGEIRS